MDLTTMWKIGTSLQILMASGSLLGSLGLAIMIVLRTKRRVRSNKTRAAEEQENGVILDDENQPDGNFQDEREEGDDQQRHSSSTTSSVLPWKRVRKHRRSAEKEGNPLSRIMFCIAVSDVLQSLGILLGKCQ